jgi:hypothetical protein
VAKIETLLGLAGVMDLKATDGPTGFAGQRLLDGIRVFQKQHGLSVDGRLNPGGPTLKALSQSLQSMGRNGDTVLAHLSPAEAQVLHAITDGGSINPKTGLLEFWTGNPGDRDNANANPGFAGPSGSNNADTVGEKMKEMHNAREAAMAAASPTPSPNNANTVGEKHKEIHNARQAKMAAASSTSSSNNTNTVGEKLKEMHNAREARMASALYRNDLEPFGGNGPDIPADKSNVEKALANRARKVLQERKDQKKAAQNPRFNRTYRSLLEDVQIRQPLKTTTPPSKLDEPKQTRPSISQQVKNIEQMEQIEKKEQKINEPKTSLAGGAFNDLVDDIKDRWNNPKNNQWNTPKANTMSAEEGKKIAKEIGTIIGLEAVGVGLKAKAVATPAPKGQLLDKLGDAALNAADHLKNKWGYE